MNKKEDRKNILIAVPNDALGGAEQYLKMVAQYFLEKRHSVVVVFLKRKHFNEWEDLEQFSNINLIYGNHNSELKGIWGFISTVIRLKKINFKYIFSSHVHLNGVLGILKSRGRLKGEYFVGRESTSIFQRFTGIKLFTFRLLYIFGYPQLDLLICQTDDMKYKLKKALPKLGQKIKVQVIPNPINLKHIQRKSKENLDITPYGNYIVSAGRLIHLKGYDLLIKAFLKLNKKELNLLILGEGNKRDILEELISNLDLENRVFLLGRLENVYPYFKQARACVVSSRMEGFPNVLLQMMSQNTKVVSTTCAGGIKEIPGIFTCNTDDINDLQNAIERSLKTDTKKNRELFDELLRERAIHNFVEKIEKIVKD